MKSIALSTLFALTLGMLTATSAWAGEAEAKCVQSGLNSRGYDAGTVDGQIGGKTQQAFEEYLAASRAPKYPLIDPTMAGWCLYLAYHEEADNATLALAAPVAAARTIKVRFAVTPADAVTKVYLKDGKGVVLSETTSFEKVVVKDLPFFVASFPYAGLEAARTICADFGNGWGVLDSKGALYSGSCDPAYVSFWNGEFSMNYKVGAKP